MEPLQRHIQLFSSAVSSPSGMQIMSRPEDEVIQGQDPDSVVNDADLLQHATTASGWHLINSLHLRSPSTPLCWQLHGGWASCIPPELLLWLPATMRVGLWSPYNTQVIGQQQTKLAYKQFVHGTEWAKCYTPSERV
ncbi:hypothetical protein FB451DRAFT_1130681 [Mycena latifolia]|nr:hypothetical protein FB451DRAFT_1130681 [Mycena latifolia]